MKIITREIAVGKTVLLRADLNVPVKEDKVLDASRIKAILPTLDMLIKAEAKVVLISHFGRPSGFEEALSLKIILDELKNFLGDKITFSQSKIGSSELLSEVKSISSGKILMLDNIRFYQGEESNDLQFAKDLASIADIYVNDAFSCSHRAHASITTIAKLLPSYAGLLLNKEVESLNQVLDKNLKPSVAIIGGSKVSTKLNVLIGGAMANTFLAAKGEKIGKSLYEPDLVSTASDIIKTARAEIILPIDALTAIKHGDGLENIAVINISAIDDSASIFDIGPESIQLVASVIDRCKLLVWNGPVGMFEDRRFTAGTEMIARKVALNTSQGRLVSIAGGGDTISALENISLTARLTYVSYAGGAFLEWLEGGTLPGLAAL
jgi:phosphoglycerate kinase